MGFRQWVVHHIVYKYFWKKGWYGVYEVAVPRSIVNKYHRERVDLLTYESTGIWRAYEIKNSVSDFRSKAALSFIGHYNYFILNHAIYDSVKDEIPLGIGVWLVYENGEMDCVKRATRKELQCPHEDMMFALMQGLSREYKKYRKLL